MRFLPWIISLLLLVGLTILWFFSSQSNSQFRSLKNENNLLKKELQVICDSIDLINNNLEQELKKLDKEIVSKEKNRKELELKIQNIRAEIQELHNLRGKSEVFLKNEKLQKNVYSEVKWLD